MTKPVLRYTTALITGAARRLGRAISVTLAARGYGVVLHYNRSATEAEALAAELRTTGAQAWTVQADLEDAESARSLMEEAAAVAGPVDILINSASIFTPSGLDDFSEADLMANVRVNALAPALIARAFAAQKRNGCIVNLLDSRVCDYDTAHVAYHLSKRMLAALTSMMAVEYAPAIRVNAVAPGLILPPEGQDEAYLVALASSNPLNTHGAPEDIARAVCFLIDSGFVTGQTLYVDGGRHLRGKFYE